MGITFASTWKWLIAGIVATWASIPVIAHLLLMLMALDFASGLLAAFNNKSLCSEAGWVGIRKKCLTLLLVAACHIASKMAGFSYDFGTLVATGFAINELISITENAARAGVRVPAVILNAIAKAKTISQPDKGGN